MNKIITLSAHSCREWRRGSLITRRKFLRTCASTLMGLYFLQDTLVGAVNSEIPVLLYHRVGYSQGHLTVTPERFSRDLVRLIDNGYQTISLAQFNSFMSGNAVNLPQKPILITFDDGYADNYENAYFSLLNYGMTAAFFIITDLLWTPGRISPDNIREMHQNGMSFGSHTVSHRNLADLPLADTEDELKCSRTTLESVLGITIDSIAYPQGGYNEDVIKAAAQTGYHYGFTTMNGTCSSGTPPFELHRIPVFSYDGNIISIINKRRNG